MIQATETLKFTTYLPSEAHQIAKKFSREQSLRQKAKQVYLNTLAVYAGNSFLEYLGFETDLQGSDSWNPIKQTFLDVADLKVKNLGKLECRPVLPNSEVVSIGLDVWENRIGYLAVELDESQNKATLLGFVETVETEELPIEQLRSLTDLIDLVSQAQQPVLAEQGAKAQLQTESIIAQQPEPVKMPVQLLQWLKNTFELDWQAVENLLGSEPRNLAYIPRTTQANISRAKLIDLEMHLRGEAVTLLVNLRPQPDEKMEIIVQLHPVAGAKYLPPNIKLALLSGAGRVIREVESRSRDYCIQLNPFKYKIEIERSFRIRVALGDVSITEDIFAL